jgi:hypothetical protein
VQLFPLDLVKEAHVAASSNELMLDPSGQREGGGSLGMYSRPRSVPIEEDRSLCGRPYSARSRIMRK